MRIPLSLAIAVLLFATSGADEQQPSWSWNPESTPNKPPTDQFQDPESARSEYSALQANTTDADVIIDTILESSRTGRNVDGFDEVYTDPSIQEALQKGDDSEARNLIKDRLCNLGLMQCDGEDVQEKRPYISPEELVYAQPVAINPVGRPIPTLPVRNPHFGTYGPPRPISVPQSGKYPPKYGPPSPHPPNKFGPPSFAPNHKFGPPLSGPPTKFSTYPNKPPRRGYGPVLPSTKPYYGPPSNKPYLNDQEVYEEGFIRPDQKPEGSYHFEGFSDSVNHKDKKVEVVVNAQGTAGTQQHVHHHFHHNGDEGKAPTVVVQPVPVPSATLIGQGFGSGGSHNFGSSSVLGSSSGAFSSGSSLFKPVDTGFAPTFGGSSLGASYGGQTIANYGGTSSNFGFGKPVVESQGPQSFGNSFGTSVGQFGQSGLYKKELVLGNGNSINSNYLQSSYADKYQGLESARAENYDCICVPYDQCPSSDIIGKRDDLYLPLDPRNLKTDIEAEEERVITDGNGTMSVVRVPKDTSLQANATEEVKDEKKISKRETKDAEPNVEGKAKVEARQYGGSLMNNKKIKPTFGISFGLPNQATGYPVNPYGPNPLHNPYGATTGSNNGINLGLVSVNPLISLQVTKDDYGDKVLKPFVNLHVTPNNYLVNKFENLLHYKKAVVFNKHKHLHYHKPNQHYYQEGPSHYDGPVHGGPIHYSHPGPVHHDHSGPIHYDHSGPMHHDYSSPPHYGPSDHSGPIHYGHPGPVEYDSPPPDYHGSYDSSPPSHFSGPSHHHGPSKYVEETYPPQQFSYFDDPNNYGGQFGQGYAAYDENAYGRALANSSYSLGNSLLQHYQQNQFDFSGDSYGQVNVNEKVDPQSSRGGKSLFSSSASPSNSQNTVRFPASRKRRDVTSDNDKTKRQANYNGRPQVCGPRHVCCRRPLRPQVPVPSQQRQCGTRHSQGINGRIKNPVYVDGDSEFGEYPWQVAILKKDPKESVYVCGGTLIDSLHIITAAHCVKTYTGFDLRVRLGEWDVNHDVEFYPYIERDIASVHVHPEFYAGALYNDLAVLRMDKPVDWTRQPHISPACLPAAHDDYANARCWTTGWGKDAFGDFGKYQNILKEVDVPVVGHGLCQRQLQQTRLGRDFQLHPGFVCAGGEEGKDACKGDGGGPMVCERGGTWQVVGVVSWGIGCGQVGVPGVYVRVAHYLDWIRQVTQRY